MFLNVRYLHANESVPRAEEASTTLALTWKLTSVRLPLLCTFPPPRSRAIGRPVGPSRHLDLAGPIHTARCGWVLWRDAAWPDLADCVCGNLKTDQTWPAGLSPYPHSPHHFWWSSTGLIHTLLSASPFPPLPCSISRRHVASRGLTGRRRYDSTHARPPCPRACGRAND